MWQSVTLDDGLLFTLSMRDWDRLDSDADIVESYSIVVLWLGLLQLGQYHGADVFVNVS